MRVAMLSAISWRTPPRAYGPWELVTSLLTEALVARGVDVTLFATLDSETSGTLAGVAPRGYSEDSHLDPKVWEALHISHLFERASEFDLIHNQADFMPLIFAHMVETPMVTTIHGLSSPKILPVYEKYDKRVHYVSISNADRAPSLTYAATIHHGIEIERFPFCAEGGESLLFFGRIHPDKGAGEAIRAARAAGRRLIMCGLIQDEAYHAREVQPFIDDKQVVFRGLVGSDERPSALGRAKALLHLIGFDEPFGLSVIEAMACGTPVIAYRRGSMAELIEDGVTGFLVDSFDEAVEAIGRIGEIDRGACRRAVAESFTLDTMADRYLALYRKLIARSDLEAGVA
jgi:glycosyltransferase involved in cell wall biosynthesis